MRRSILCSVQPVFVVHLHTDHSVSGDQLQNTPPMFPLQVGSGELARPHGRPVLSREQLYTKKKLPARNEGHEL